MGRGPEVRARAPDCRAVGVPNDLPLSIVFRPTYSSVPRWRSHCFVWIAWVCDADHRTTVAERSYYLWFALARPDEPMRAVGSFQHALCHHPVMSEATTHPMAVDPVCVWSYGPAVAGAAAAGASPGARIWLLHSRLDSYALLRLIQARCCQAVLLRDSGAQPSLASPRCTWLLRRDQPRQLGRRASSVASDQRAFAPPPRPPSPPTTFIPSSLLGGYDLSHAPQKYHTRPPPSPNDVYHYLDPVSLIAIPLPARC